MKTLRPGKKNLIVSEELNNILETNLSSVSALPGTPFPFPYCQTLLTIHSYALATNPALYTKTMPPRKLGVLLVT